MCLAASAFAEDEAPSMGGAPAHEYAAPSGSERLRANERAPSIRQAPKPAPGGCPYRDGTLELIV
jgi:hypothetical protein